ncbi:ATP-binding protein [Desulfopila sp. IMCC35008]|uniref:ATP-binding protein n=1 Tax=Desulfopila sp. IMCC35008 TaxID=2653858 RepID=UPI0013D00EC7|nr:ATP-binding protein [Desulfopila sp. IMCC35008]
MISFTRILSSIVTTTLPLFLLLPWIFLSVPHDAHGSLQRNVLIIHSYHVGYKWTDDTYRGILEGLSPEENEISLHVEYLDMKRYYSDKRYYQAALWLGQKYIETPIDLIIATDDTAFIFLKEFGSTLYPGTPIFFCGTNYLEEEALKGLDNFYGVTEKADISATIQVILDTLPETRQIFIINDTTVTGRRVHKEIEQAISGFQNSVEFTFLEDIAMADLITKISSLPENSVIFYTFFFRDKNGMTFEYDQTMRLLSRQANRPMFGAWDFNFGLGIVGGKLTSGKQQGLAVASLALSSLNGTPLAQIPRVTSSPNMFMFDYEQLKKHNIALSRLPTESQVFNLPPNFLKQHKKVLIGAALVTSSLIVVITILSINIHRRKRAEKKLRQSEKNFRDIFNNTQEGLYQSTAQGTFIQVNPALAHMMKCSSPQEMMDYYTDIRTQFYPSPEDRLKLLSRCEKEQWVKQEITLKCRDGSEIEVLETLHSVHDEQGKFLYFEGSCVDLTEYKKTQELISQTDKMLSLGGVSAGIAHEIRSPLSTIALGTQVITSRLADDNKANLEAASKAGTTLEHIHAYAKERELARMLSDIHESALRAGVIVDDMLSYSKKSIGEFEYTSLIDIVNKTLAFAKKDYTLRNMCRFDAIDIRKDFDDSLPKVYCSSSKIQQVIFNILKNGAEAMQDAGTQEPSFTLRLIKEHNRARLEIEDNGPGMSTNLQKKIFQPFFTTKSKEKGTGLGLSVSSFIIKENHHGDLQVDSTPGMGTTFIILLPYMPPKEEQDDKEPVI